MLPPTLPTFLPLRSFRDLMLVSAAIFKASGEVAMVASTTIEPRTIRGIQVAVPDEPMSISPAMVASASAGPPENWVISALMPCFL